jgi:hypothetical protein
VNGSDHGAVHGTRYPHAIHIWSRWPRSGSSVRRSTAQSSAIWARPYARRLCGLRRSCRHPVRGCCGRWAPHCAACWAARGPTSPTKACAASRACSEVPPSSSPFTRSLLW